MGYELRTMVVEPKRQTFDPLVARFGDRPATRYQEGSFDVQATEHFHYRPTWDPAHELYDTDYSALKLTDAYSYADPRQYYYATYVTDAAARYDAFAQTLGYIEDRRLLDRLPEEWRLLLTGALIPLRHYEQGAQLISSEAARFSYGTTISQAATYAAFDRIGNAQLYSLVGLALAGGASNTLTEAKENWLFAPSLQPMRKMVEELLVEKDWATGLVGLELLDAQLYPLLFTQLDERALSGGAMAYSLIAQHMSDWYKSQKKWLTPLFKAWTADPTYGEANKKVLGDIVSHWHGPASAAVRAIADEIAGAGIPAVVNAAERGAAEALAELAQFGVTVHEGAAA